MVKRMRLVGAIGLLGLTAFIGCSSDDDDDPLVPSTTQGSGTNASGSGTASGSGSGSGSGTGGGSSSSGSGSGSSSSGNGNVTGSSTTGAAGATGTTGGGPGGPACAGFPIEETQEEVCVGTGYEAERADVDMYIMVDHTSSMDNTDEVSGGATRWELTKAAINEFVTSRGAENIRVALQFFAHNTESDCNVNNYNTPLVDMDFAPDNADTIESEMNKVYPTGLTPTYPALQGAIEFAKDWQENEGRGRQTVVVFVTDGYPTECDPKEPSAVAQLARDSFLEEPRVPVYVIGLDGVLNLDQIAQAGGTGDAYDITSGGSTDEFVQALSNITNSEVTCEFQIPEPPDGQVIDYDEVQVVYEPASGETVEVPFSASGYSGCNDSDQGGWYFGGADASGNYTKILTCPCTCSAFQAGVVEVRLGCSPRPVIN